MADIYKVSQCRDSPSAKEEQGEGCQVVGHVALSSGGGNLHFAPGRGLEHFGHESEMNMMDYILEAFENFNVTHTINKLRFGDEYPGAIYQLDNQTRTVEDGHGMYQYYMKVVPTTYTYLHGKENIESNQFSVTEHLRHVNPGSGRGKSNNCSIKLLHFKFKNILQIVKKQGYQVYFSCMKLVHFMLK